MRYLRSLLHAAVSGCALAACGGGGGGDGNGGVEPPPSASITGTVTNASTDQPLAGATVSAGSIQATTDANGRFDLVDVPVGPSVGIRSELPGFVAYSADIAVVEGSNTHDIAMARQSLYEVPDFAVYIPPDVSTVRGVIYGLVGGDTRGLASDVYNDPDPAVREAQRLFRQSFLTLAAVHGLAIMGSQRLADNPASDARVVSALNVVGLASGRPELAQAPLLLFGASGGAPQSYGFTLRHADRVIGFTVLHGTAPSNVRSAAAQRVPGYVLLAELDEEVNNGELTKFFMENRAEGALWTFAVEPGATHLPSDGARSMISNWMNTILELRLPQTVTPGAPVLRSIDEASGWLGNRTTFAIAPYADYADDRLDASWFPSQQTAQAWVDFVTPQSQE